MHGTEHRTNTTTASRFHRTFYQSMHNGAKTHAQTDRTDCCARRVVSPESRSPISHGRCVRQVQAAWHTCDMPHAPSMAPAFVDRADNTSSNITRGGAHAAVTSWALLDPKAWMNLWITLRPSQTKGCSTQDWQSQNPIHRGVESTEPMRRAQPSLPPRRT